MAFRILKKVQDARNTPFIRSVSFYQMRDIVMQLEGFALSVLYARVLTRRTD